MWGSRCPHGPSPQVSFARGWLCVTPLRDLRVGSSCQEGWWPELAAHAGSSCGHWAGLLSQGPSHSHAGPTHRALLSSGTQRHVSRTISS